MRQAIFAAVMLAACGKSHDKPAPNAETAKPNAETAKPNDQLDFTAWDMPTRIAAWQGAWAGEGLSKGEDAAWEIKGDDVEFVDHNGVRHMKLEVTSPCKAAFVEENARWLLTYTLARDGLVTGWGAAGARKGGHAIVCAGGDTFVFDGSGCTHWTIDEHYHPQSAPATCGFGRGESGEETFHVNRDGEETTQFVVDGDALMTKDLSRMHAKKLPDLAAAKAEQKL
jgi:hypothetical protein